MNRRSYGYLVRALNEFASLTARCGLKDAHRPIPAKVPIRIDGYRGNPGIRCRRSARITASRDPERAALSFSKKIA